MAIESRFLALEGAFRWEEEAPDRVYLTQPMGDGETREITWKETLDEARRMAAHLQSLNLPPKSSIAILSKNCAHFVMTDLAIWMAGHVSVALYPTVDAETVDYILNHCEAKLLFVGKLDAWENMKPGVPDGLPSITYPLSPPEDYPTWDDVIAKHERLEGKLVRPREDTAMLVYTSGSTGTPKGVITTFANMATATWGAMEKFDFTCEDRQLSYLPLAHAFERAVVENASLHAGDHLFFVESLDTFGRDLAICRPTIFHSVPRLWLKFQLAVFEKLPEKKLRRLLKIPILRGIIRKKILKGLGLDQTRYAISGSAPIPASLIQWYRDLGLELLEGYAMTENFSYSHMSIPGQSRVGYVGNTLPGVECKLSDDGEVLVKSDANMPGYYKEPELTATAYTEDGFLKTGDQGELDDMGRLKITGRVKELFKTSKGKYIAPVPIENILNAHHYIEQSCVSGTGFPQPYATVLLSEGVRQSLDDEAVRADISASLGSLLDEVNAAVAQYERLEFLAIAKDEWLIENGLLTPTMKIKRSALEGVYDPQLEGWYQSDEKVIWES